MMNIKSLKSIMKWKSIIKWKYIHQQNILAIKYVSLVILIIIIYMSKVQHLIQFRGPCSVASYIVVDLIPQRLNTFIPLIPSIH